MDQMNCRVCGGAFNTDHLVYENMPRAAQHFPAASDLVNEQGETLIIRQCARCGLVQSASPPVSYFRDVIRATAFSPEMGAFRLDQFKRLDAQYNFASRRVLEIGSGRGEYLELMKSLGWEVHGLEHDPVAVDHGLKKGLSIQQGYPENGEFVVEGGPFQAFAIFNFLEHVPRINDFLSAIRNNLTDGALGLVEVPNFDLMVEKAMSTEFIADHLFYFSVDTLKRTLEINGFDVLECEVTWHNYIISAVVKKRSPTSFKIFVDQENNLRQEIRQFVDDPACGELAIWGAGHQALATIMLARLTPRIKYVIDSAPFKQGKYTPASHLPIHGPDMLGQDPVDTILIMAAAYSDEVAEQIRSTYGTKFRVAILRESGLEVIQ